MRKEYKHNTKEIHQTTREEKKEHRGITKQPENNEQNGNKFILITLNVNGLNSPIKRHRVAEWIKNKTHLCFLKETHFRSKDTHRLKVKGQKKIFHANGNEKKASVAILISDKTDFKTKNVIKDKECHYIMIKGSVHQEDVTFVNIYAPNIEAPKYIKRLLTHLKGELDSNTIIVGGFNIPLTSLDRSSRQKIKKISASNNLLDQMATCIYVCVCVYV